MQSNFHRRYKWAFKPHYEMFETRMVASPNLIDFLQARQEMLAVRNCVPNMITTRLLNERNISLRLTEWRIFSQRLYPHGSRYIAKSSIFIDAHGLGGLLAGWPDEGQTFSSNFSILKSGLKFLSVYSATISCLRRFVGITIDCCRSAKFWLVNSKMGSYLQSMVSGCDVVHYSIRW